MAEKDTRHNAYRDQLISTWADAPSLICEACVRDFPLPSAHAIKPEVRYFEGLRADIGAFDSHRHLMGTTEVIDTSEPTETALEAQARLTFAYYVYLPNSPVAHRGVTSDAIWLCSVECFRWWRELGGCPRSEAWEAPKCDVCRGYLHRNSISRAEFRSWAYDPYTAHCIHCATIASATTPNIQWRAPGELAGGDPRKWTPSVDADPVTLLLAYSEARFWAMVWAGRVKKLDEEPDLYDGSDNPSAEEATAERLLQVNAFFDAHEWATGANLLLPIGAPAWAAYKDEPQRLQAFRPDNCRGTAAAWERLLGYRLGQLPGELSAVARLHQQYHALAAGIVRARSPTGLFVSPMRGSHLIPHVTLLIPRYVRRGPT